MALAFNNLLYYIPPHRCTRVSGVGTDLLTPPDLLVVIYWVHTTYLFLDTVNQMEP